MTIASLVVFIIWLLVVVAFVVLALWLIDLLFSALASSGVVVPPAIPMILKIVVVAVAVLWVLSWFVGLLPGPPHFGSLNG